MNLINKWGGTNLNNIFQANQVAYVHPDDWVFLKNYEYIRSLHQCIGIEENYITLEFYKIKIRVTPDVFHPIDDKPEFNPLEKVKLITSKGKMEMGIVKGIYWHNNERKIIYEIEVNGKLKGRKYSAEELDRV